MLRRLPISVRSTLWFVAALGLMGAAVNRAAAEALLLVEVDSGKVLHAENATIPWYPASVTKLMTAYVTLHAVMERQVTLDTLLNVSDLAAAQEPTKMGFKPGTKVTIDNALKMMMVKSANDMAIALAEGIGGSVENFATEMNRAARRLGMTQSSFVNPNGLPPDPMDAQVTSARDLAILTRALLSEFPEYDLYWHIPAIKLGRRIIRNHNPLIDRYPGADGMKTGFICAAGYNLVATATRDNKRLIAVVLGAPSSAARAQKAVQLFEKGFNGGFLAMLTPAMGTVDGLAPVATEPPNLREEVCDKRHHRPTNEAEEEAQQSDLDPNSPLAALAQGLPPTRALLGPQLASMPPIEVFVGPPRKQGAANLAAMHPSQSLPATAVLGQSAPAAGSATDAAPASVALPWLGPSLTTPAAAAGADAADAAPAAVSAIPIPRPRPRN